MKLQEFKVLLLKMQFMIPSTSCFQVVPQSICVSSHEFWYYYLKNFEPNYKVKVVNQLELPTILLANQSLTIYCTFTYFYWIFWVNPPTGIILQALQIWSMPRTRVATQPWSMPLRRRSFFQAETLGRPEASSTQMESKCIDVRKPLFVRWFRFGNDLSASFFFGWELLLWQRFLAFFFPATETQLGHEIPNRGLLSGHRNPSTGNPVFVAMFCLNFCESQHESSPNWHTKWPDSTSIYSSPRRKTIHPEES